MEPNPMKKLLLAFALMLICTEVGHSQCNGVFPNNTACGNITGSSQLPRPIPLSSFPPGPPSPPGGSPGQIQYNNAGAFGGFTASGDAQVNTGTGVVTIQPGAVTNSKL